MSRQSTLVLGRVDWAMLLGLSVLWGGSFLFNGILVQSLPLLTIVAGRVAIAAATLWATLNLLKIPAPRGWGLWMALFGMGLLNNVVPFTLIVWGQTHISAGLAAIFNATTPLFTVLLAHMVTSEEKLSPAKAIGLLLGLAGVVVLIGPEVLQGIGSAVLFQFAVIAAAISYACAGIFGRRFRAQGLDPVAAATGQVTASTILLAPVALLVDEPWTLAPLPPHVWLAWVGLGVVSTALAYILYFRLLAHAGATNASLVTMLIPVSAVILGAILLHEHISLDQVLGMALIALGVLAIDGRLRRLASFQIMGTGSAAAAGVTHVHDGD